MTEPQEDRAYDALTHDLGQEVARVAAEHAASVQPAAGAAGAGARWRAAFASRTRRVVLAGGTVAVAGTAAALLLFGPSSGGPLDVVAQAEAAIAPTGYVVHVAMKVEAGFDGRRAGGAKKLAPTSFEQWTATDPTRWRASETPQRLTRGRAAFPTQVAYANGAQSHYEPTSHAMVTVTGFSDHGAAARIVTPIFYGPQTVSGSASDSDPLALVRSMLAKGTLRDAGTTVIAGRSVRRLTGRVVRHERGSRDGRPFKFTETSSYEYDVDATSYVPVRIEIRVRMDYPRAVFPHMTTPMRWLTTADISTYERLPMTPANEALLTIRPPAGTKIRTMTVQQARTAAARRERRMLLNSRTRKRP